MKYPDRIQRITHLGTCLTTRLRLAYLYPRNIQKSTLDTNSGSMGKIIRKEGLKFMGFDPLCVEISRLHCSQAWILRRFFGVIFVYYIIKEEDKNYKIYVYHILISLVTL